MSKTRAMRLSGLAAIVGGILMIPASFTYEQPAFIWVGVVGWILLTFGLIGTYAYQAEESGLVGFLGFVVLLTGGLFFIGEGRLFGMDYYMLGGTLSALGLILLGIGTLRAGRFPRWVAWAWIAGVIVGIPSLYLADLAWLFGFLGSAGLGLGFVGTGYTLWTRSG